MPDHELSLIVLVHVLNSYLQKKSAFSSHSKLPLTTVLADFASTLTNYEKAFGYPPDTTPLNASSLSQIINSSSLKNNFIIKSENGGELLLSGPINQAQSALVSAVVDTSIKYGKTLIGQLQGLKDEYHSLSSESESSKPLVVSASKVSENDQIAESDDHEISVPTTSTDATKTENSSESEPGEIEAMEIDEQNAEQDSKTVDGTSEVENPASSLNDEKKEEIEENDDEGSAEEEEENLEVEEKNSEEKEIEGESIEKQNPEDLLSESVTQEKADSQANDEEQEAEIKEKAENNEEPEIAQEEDQDIDSSRKSDESASDEIERSSRLLLEESERDNAEVGNIEKPRLADVEGETEEEIQDKTGKPEEAEEENEENEPVAETHIKTTLQTPVVSEPDEVEQANDIVEDGEEETYEDDTQNEAEKHDTPQEKSKLSTASSRKRKAEEASVEDDGSDSPKKPRKAKDTSSTTRRKGSAAEPKLTPAQKYKRFQNIAINLIKSIEAHRFSSPFLIAVTAPEYSQVVKHPRDLKSIMKNVRRRHDSAVYTSVKELERDIMLMFANCVMFNKSSTPLVQIAQEMKNDVRNTFKMFEETESSIS